MTHCGAPALSSCDVAIWQICRLLWSVGSLPSPRLGTRHCRGQISTLEVARHALKYSMLTAAAPAASLHSRDSTLHRLAYWAPGRASGGVTFSSPGALFLLAGCLARSVIPGEPDSSSKVTGFLLRRVLYIRRAGLGRYDASVWETGRRYKTSVAPCVEARSGLTYSARAGTLSPFPIVPFGTAEAVAVVWPLDDWVGGSCDRRRVLARADARGSAGFCFSGMASLCVPTCRRGRW